MCVCVGGVCVLVHASVRAYVRTCVRARVRARARVCVCVNGYKVVTYSAAKWVLIKVKSRDRCNKA